MHKQGLIWGMLLGTVLTSPGPVASEVYKWVARDGVTHYSESEPGPQPAGVETLELADVAAPAAARSDYRAALEVAKDIERGRLERERLRLERRRLQQDQAQAAAREQRQAAEDTRYYPVYPYYRRYVGKRPHRLTHPRHGGPKATPRNRYAREEYGPRGGVRARLPAMTNR